MIFVAVSSVLPGLLPERPRPESSASESSEIGWVVDAARGSSESSDDQYSPSPLLPLRGRGEWLADSVTSCSDDDSSVSGREE